MSAVFRLDDAPNGVATRRSVDSGRAANFVSVPVTGMGRRLGVGRSFEPVVFSFVSLDLFNNFLEQANTPSSEAMVSPLGDSRSVK